MLVQVFVLVVRSVKMVHYTEPDLGFVPLVWTSVLSVVIWFWASAEKLPPAGPFLPAERRRGFDESLLDGLFEGAVPTCHLSDKDWGWWRRVCSRSPGYPLPYHWPGT
jgi:hypothetical protein